MTPLHGAVLLAAGGSSRLGRSKQLVEVDGEALVRRAARAALATQPVELVVVTGAEPAVADAVAGLPLRLVRCDDWRDGLAASLRVGVDTLDPRCAGVLVLLTDQPALDAAFLQALVRAWRAEPEAAAAARYAGVRGVPALLPRAWFPAIAALEGDQGARALLRRPDARVVELDAPALSRDVDVPGDL